MKVKEPELDTSIAVGQLIPGDVFVYNGNVFMYISPVSGLNCVDVERGTVHKIGDITLVFPKPSSELIVK